MNPTPTLSFMEAIKKVFANYANFNGRARRSEFWWWYLCAGIVNFILYLPIQILTAKKAAITEQLTQQALNGDISLSEIEAQANAQDPTTMIWIFGIIYLIVGIALFIPTLAAGVRRLHDVGKSGHLWWLILACGIGVLVPLIMCIPDGQPHPNQYGPSPKFPDAQPAAQPFGPQPMGPQPMQGYGQPMQR